MTELMKLMPNTFHTYHFKYSYIFKSGTKGFTLKVSFCGVLVELTCWNISIAFYIHFSPLSAVPSVWIIFEIRVSWNLCKIVNWKNVWNWIYIELSQTQSCSGETLFFCHSSALPQSCHPCPYTALHFTPL